jgi:hypothetical protein
VAVVAYYLFCLEIDSFNIQEEGKETLTLLSGSENNSIRKMQLLLQMLYPVLRLKA